MKRAGPSSPGRRRLFALPLLLAAMACARAAVLDPESDTFYQMARHLLTRNEERVFRRLAAPELRRDFIRAFWEIRDSDPATEENEFRDEMEKRLAFVNGHFREANRDGWNTARGMIYLVLGPPDSPNEISPLNDPTSSGTIRWHYGDIGFYVQFVDAQGFGVYELDMAHTPLALMDYLEMSKNLQLAGPETEIAGRYLQFAVAADPRRDRLAVSIPVRDLAFESGPEGRRVASLHVAFNLYLADGTIASNHEERRLDLGERELQDGRLRFEMALPLRKGRNRLDLLVADRIGGKMNRRLFTLKKK